MRAYFILAAGLVVKTKERFWSHVAEYPTHHLQLPPNTEREFVESINNGENSLPPPLLQVITPGLSSRSLSPSFFCKKKKKQKKICEMGWFSPLPKVKLIKLSRDMSI